MKNGFSFLEILIAILLISIFLYITLILFRSKPDLKIILEDFTTQLKEDLRYVRMRAIITDSYVELRFNPLYTSYTFLDDRGFEIKRENKYSITINPTGTVFSFDSEGDLTISGTFTSGEIRLFLDIYSSTLKINNKGFIEVQGP